MAPDHTTHKRRDIRFCRLNPVRQAEPAALMVSAMEGVDESTPVGGYQLLAGYDLLQISLRTIEERLAAEGYHLENSLLCKLKRALYYYTEEVERENLGIGGGANTQVYVERYRRLPHGCRDERPEHWRGYL